MQKERLGSLIKWILFFIAYYPLILIISIKQSNLIDNLINLNSLSWFDLNDIFIYVLFIGIFLAVFLFWFLEGQDSANTKQYKVLSVKDVSHETLSYILTYIIAFLSLDLNSFKDLLGIVILVYIIGIIYVNSNLIYVNPVLQAAGYSILSVEVCKEIGTNSKEIILVTKSSSQKLKKGSNISISLINAGINEIYYSG